MMELQRCEWHKVGLGVMTVYIVAMVQYELSIFRYLTLV